MVIHQRADAMVKEYDGALQDDVVDSEMTVANLYIAIKIRNKNQECHT